VPSAAGLLSGVSLSSDRRLLGDEFEAVDVTDGSTAGAQGVALVDSNAPYGGPRDLVGWQSEAQPPTVL